MNKAERAKFRKDMEASGGTAEQMSLLLLESIEKLERVTRWLTLVLIALGGIQVWLAVVLIRRP